MQSIEMIQTQRTFLKAIKPSDNEAVFAYRSDAETNKFQGWIPKTIEEVNEFIAKNPQEFNEPNTWFQWVIIERETQQLIGDIGIHFMNEAEVELGCTLSKKHHGKGYASEALKAVIDHLFHRYKKQRVKTSMDPQNKPAIQLMERLGFKKEALYKKSVLINGKWVDDLVYSLIKSDWN